MIRLPSRLRRLDDALADLPIEDEAMMLSELDGFLTGILVSPDPILPGEWLPLVWGGGDRPPYDEPADMRWFADMVLARCNEIARDVARGKPQPLFDVDERNGELLWDRWIEGFGTAMALRPDSWSELAESGDAEIGDAVSGMTTLVEIATEESLLTSIEINAICDDAADLIPRLVTSLHARRISQSGPAPETRRPAKVGRNDPCSCGSGRKHKRCCGPTS